MSWEEVIPLVGMIDLEGRPDNQPVVLKSVPQPLEIIGVGTDAVVVRHPDVPDTVYKVYAPGREQVQHNEQQVYERLGDSRWFPSMKGAYPGVLVLSYEEGPTLYECLTKGIPIPPSVVAEVDQARQFVRSKGMNPRDIHLKNVLLQQGHAKILDVSEYLKSGDDGRWDQLVSAYHLFYPLFRGRPIAADVLEEIKQAYRLGGPSLSVMEWGRRFLSRLSQKDHTPS
jgi:hypothetical protein